MLYKNIAIMSAIVMLVTGIYKHSKLMSKLKINKNFLNDIFIQRMTNAVSTSYSDSLITKLTIDDIDSIANVMENAFSYSNSHSWSRALGVPPRMGAYMKSGILTEPLQFKIGCYGEKVSVESNKLKGLIITEELETPLHITNLKIELNEKEELTAYEIMDSLIVESKILFYNELHRRHFHRTREYKCAYISWIATDAEYRNQGVAHRLIDKADERIRSNGYDCSVVICSNPTSTQVFQSKGYEIWESIEYKTFRVDDEVYPFQALNDSCNIMVKEFNNNMIKASYNL